MNEESIFAEAIARPIGERAAYLDEACGDDAVLRERVELLLRSHDEAGSFLEKPAEEEFEATLDLSADDRSRISAKTAALRASQDRESTSPGAGKRTGEHEPPSVSVVVKPGGKRVMYFGDYELKGEIARGAMGVVYRAEQKSLKRTVAIKMIRSTLLTSEADVARFLSEAEAAASLDHPNIVPIYEVGEHEEQHYFSMKLIEGGTLRDHLERLNGDPRAAAKLMSTVVGAIHAAHQRGILHRDLKPGNILIDERGEPHVTDFGLAKQMESNSSVTLSGQIMGTPQYMAPEQAEGGGRDLTTAADIHALGAIFYEILCGRPPHQGESLMETLKLVAEEEAEPPSRYHPKVDRDLETVAMKCLEKDPAKRYASAQEMKNDLDRWLRGEPILARPVGTAEKAIKWMRRKPMHAMAAGLALTLLLTLGIGGPIKARNERDLREQKEIALAEAETYARRLRVQAYSADMNVAAHAVEQHRFARARRLLEQHLPQSGAEDIRGFEWHYLWERAQSDDIGVIGEYKGLRGGVAVSPDGALVAHNTPAGIEVRDTRTETVIHSIEVEEVEGRDYAFGLLRFSPDGRKLVCVRGRHVHRWRTDTWEAEPVAEGLGWPFVFSSDSSFVVALSGNKFVVRDGHSLEVIRELDGTFLRAFHRNFNSHTTALCPDGRTFYAAENHADGGVGIIRRWDVSTGTEQTPILPDFDATQCLTVSSRGILAASNWNGDLALWNTKTEEWVQTLEPHIAWTPMVAFSRDGSVLVTASADETICVFDIDDDGKGTLRTRLAGHENEIWALAMGNDGNFYTGSTDGTTRRWKIPARDEAGFSWFHMGRAIEFEDDGRSLVVWAKEKENRGPEGLYRLDLSSGEIEPLLGLEETIAAEIPKTPRNHPRERNTRIKGGALIALGSEENQGEITVWNLESGRKEITLDEAGFIPIAYRGSPFAFSPDGSLLATANESNGIRVWDCADWSPRDLVPEFGGRAELCFSADNRVLAALPPNPEESGVAVDVETGRVLARFDLPGLNPHVALSTDGRFLAIGSTDREVRLWDLEKGEQIHALRGHVAGIRGLAFSPDGRTLATCGDQRLKLWNVETGSELGVLANDVVEIGEPLFSPDGRTLVTKAADNYLRMWRVSLRKEDQSADPRRRHDDPNHHQR